MVEFYLATFIGVVWVAAIVYIIFNPPEINESKDDDDNDPPWTQFPPSW